MIEENMTQDHKARFINWDISTSVRFWFVQGYAFTLELGLHEDEEKKNYFACTTQQLDRIKQFQIY